MRNIVESALNELRATNNYSDERVARESQIAWDSSTQMFGMKFAPVPLSLIHIDAGYQRTENFSVRKAKQIAEHFNKSAYEPIKLNYRGGAFYCPSGQHRVYAHILMGKSHIVAELIQISREEEINVYLVQDDNRVTLTPYDRHKALLDLGDKEAISFQKTLDKYDVHLLQGEPNRLTSLNSMKRFYKRSPESFEYVFECVKRSRWHGKKYAYDSRLTRSLYRIFSVRENKDAALEKLSSILYNISPEEAYTVSGRRYASDHRDTEARLYHFFQDICWDKITMEDVYNEL